MLQLVMLLVEAATFAGVLILLVQFIIILAKVTRQPCVFQLQRPGYSPDVLHKPHLICCSQWHTVRRHHICCCHDAVLRDACHF